MFQKTRIVAAIEQNSTLIFRILIQKKCLHRYYKQTESSLQSQKVSELEVKTPLPTVIILCWELQIQFPEGQWSQAEWRAFSYAIGAKRQRYEGSGCSHSLIITMGILISKEKFNAGLSGKSLSGCFVIPLITLIPTCSNKSEDGRKLWDFLNFFFVLNLDPKHTSIAVLQINMFETELQEIL